jgi:hypothetical protein
VVLELDHVVMAVDDALDAERTLTGFGLAFGLHAVHHGQGTSNACAFFDNAYLELLGRHDNAELQSVRVRPLGLHERLHWRESGACPFGVALRAPDPLLAIPTWAYEAGFLPPGRSIPIVTPRDATHEPLVFLIPQSLPIRREPPASHRGKRRRLTRVTVWAPGVTGLPTGLAGLVDGDRLSVRAGPAHHLELEWDGAGATERHDFRPRLPFTLTW